jgi:3',5'-cyclic AMP phosphodiesterase CpdA
MRRAWHAVFALLTGCSSPGGDRAALDLEVGHGEGHGVRITVEEGLAAVRAVDNGALRLWASAPVFTMRVHFDDDAAEAWDVIVDNSLPDAVLTVVTGAGEAIDVQTSPGEFPTQRRFRFSLVKNRDLALSLRPPDADDPSAFRFALLSDVQEALDRVQDIYARLDADPSIRFVLSAGDLTDKGTAEEHDRFQKELRSLRVPFYATLGNHDIAAGDGIYQRYFGRGSFRFVYRGVQFTLLDSASASIEPAVYDMLSGWLDEGRARAHVVAMHIPPLDPVGARNAAFGSRNEAGALLERLAAGEVDLTLYGHIHAYYNFSNAGIPAVVSGGGGAHPEKMAGIGRHYVTVDIDAKGALQTGVVRVD